MYLLHGRVLNDLDPVGGGVGGENEGDLLHPPVRRPLLPLDPLLLKVAAGSVEVVYADAQVAESAIGFGVAVRVPVGGIAFPIMAQFHDALAVSRRLLALTLLPRVGQEIVCKLSFRGWASPDQFHPEDILEEVEVGLRVAYTNLI